MAKRGPKTKYKEEYAKIAEKVCIEFGADDKQLARVFGVSEATINNWKKHYPELLESIKKGKDVFDTQVVEKSLLKRALGYKYTETTREPCVVIKRKGKKPEIAEEDLPNVRSEMVITKTVTKEVAPDVTAQIFWLKNRNPERWRDKQDIAINGKFSLILKDE